MYLLLVIKPAAALPVHLHFYVPGNTPCFYI